MAPARAVIVQHRLTATPLAREHERLLARRDRRAILPIPWRRFERERYPQAALALAAGFQRDLAVGELLAVDGFSRVAAALALLAAPLDCSSARPRACRRTRFAMPITTCACSRSSRAARSTRRARRSRPTSCRRARARTPGGRRRSPRSTCGCSRSRSSARRWRARCSSSAGGRRSDPVAGALYRSVVADEIHHARLGWYYLAWRSAAWTARDRARLAGARRRPLARGAAARGLGSRCAGRRRTGCARARRARHAAAASRDRARARRRARAGRRALGLAAATR